MSPTRTPNNESHRLCHGDIDRVMGDISEVGCDIDRVMGDMSRVTVTV